MIKRIKKCISLSLAALMVSTSTIGVFAQDNRVLDANVRHELMEEGELSNSIDLGVEDINEELKEIYPYGEIVHVEETEYGTAYYVDSEYHKTRKKRFAWDALDVVMAGASWAEFFGDPSFRSLGWAVFDTAATLPGLPSSAYVRRGGKRLFDVAELKKYAKTPQGKNAIKKALTKRKYFKTAQEAKKAALKLGYTDTKQYIKQQPIFKKGKKYITPDIDGHNGGVWKMADSIKNLGNRKTRMGTYDANLRRIGD